MANIVDALLITLGLDTRDFKKGQKEAEDGLDKLSEAEKRRAKDAEAATKAMVQGLNKAKNELISLIAVAAGASSFKGLVSSMTSEQASLERVSKLLGQSAAELDAWGGALEAVGGKKADVAQMAQSLFDVYTALDKGKASAEQLSAIGVFGLNLDDLKNAPLAFEKINKALQTTNLTAQQQRIFTSALGLDDNMLVLLRKSPEALQALVQKMRELSGVTDETAQASGRLQEGWAVLKQGASGVGGAIFRELIPALTKALELLTALVEAIVNMDRATGGWSTRIIAAAAALAGLAATVKGLLAIRAVAAAAAASGGAAGAVGAAATAGAGALGSAGMVGAVGLAGAYAVWQTNRLYEGLKDWWDVKHREGVVLAQRGGASPAAGNLPRGVRNNNPGNLNFAGQAGATREDGPGRFAKFATMEEGVGALVKQLRLYAKRGINTIRGIVNKYAPASENNVGAYISALVKATGLGADDPLNLDDESTVRSLVKGITTHENGRGYLTEQQITGGVRIGARASLGGAGSAGAKVETHIETVTINTSAQNAPGIARDLNSELQQQTMLAVNNGYAL